jgi:hypothetical protein
MVKGALVKFVSTVPDEGGHEHSQDLRPVEHLEVPPEHPAHS